MELNQFIPDAAGHLKAAKTIAGRISDEQKVGFLVEYLKLNPMRPQSFEDPVTGKPVGRFINALRNKRAKLSADLVVKLEGIRRWAWTHAEAVAKEAQIQEEMKNARRAIPAVPDAPAAAAPPSAAVAPSGGVAIALTSEDLDELLG
jgi:hypothetical protein